MFPPEDDDGDRLSIDPGRILVWLVILATLGAAAYVLFLRLQEVPPVDSGETIARTAPIGRLTLVGQPPPAAEAVPAVAAGLDAGQPSTEPASGEAGKIDRSETAQAPSSAPDPTNAEPTPSSAETVPPVPPATAEQAPSAPLATAGAAGSQASAPAKAVPAAAAPVRPAAPQRPPAMPYGGYGGYGAPAPWFGAPAQPSRGPAQEGVPRESSGRSAGAPDPRAQAAPPAAPPAAPQAEPRRPPVTSWPGYQGGPPYRRDAGPYQNYPGGGYPHGYGPQGQR